MHISNGIDKDFGSYQERSEYRKERSERTFSVSRDAVIWTTVQYLEG